MARVTIEDCLLYIPNRFKIVEIAAQRAREIANGAMTTVDGHSAAAHKATVLALKEIATGKVDQGQESNEFSEFDLFDDEFDMTSSSEEKVSFENFDQLEQPTTSADQPEE